jgi:DNA helicase HerA-like ATPase
MPDADGNFAFSPRQVTPEDLQVRLDPDIAQLGGEAFDDMLAPDAIGATMFDLPNSEDNSVTVLLPKDSLDFAPSQALVRIKSRDGRPYLGIVTAGPFAEPDSLRGDSPMLVTIATRRGIYLPPFHGRVQVELLGEENPDGTLSPPRLRPRPASPVFALSDEEAAKVLQAEGDIRLGTVAGKENLVVSVPSTLKSVLPRHTAVLGTTGGGKSTTIARLVQQAQAAGMAVILLDVEGEYAFLHEPTADAAMLSGLARRGLAPAGVPVEQMQLYHLTGRETANPRHPHRQAFSLQFARLSPYAVIEILALSEAQAERFLRAYDLAKVMLRFLKIFPAPNNAEQERIALEIDEFERGYPRLTLSLLMDIVAACLAVADKVTLAAEQEGDGATGAGYAPYNAFLRAPAALAELQRLMKALSVPGNAISWRALLGRLARLNRLKVFDVQEKDSAGRSIAPPLQYRTLLRPGNVAVVDLSDTGASELSNIVIADLLRGVQEAQDDAYQDYEKAKAPGHGTPPSRVLVIVEEAHEFLSAERIEKMPILFQQVARIAKRGRKRWMGLVFVTQLPQHLPRQLFGLVNSYILHKITDPQVVSTLHRTVSGIDESLWNRLSGLAPGQAVVSFPHMTRPLLVSIDPTPAKLRMVD